MPLEAGQKLAQYEIVASIGRGGMGEVFRARDTKLGREVAIKVLPEELAEDRERLVRFEREARVLAQLNHPNIATLYGLEEANGQPFLVMELVEGETLGEHLGRGPIRVEEAIRLFIQIAEGLEAAHERGIVHRDLKPANIKVSSDGKVKILDFGLAKAFQGEPDVAVDASQSPTLTKGTALGAIMGTAAYMSPEQARGKAVDKRTDVWAFGCCLYEALTGRKAFDGETTTDVLSAVLSREPDWNRIPAGLPAGMKRLLRRGLQKDRGSRLHDIADARLELEEARDVSPEEAMRKRARLSWSWATALAIGGLLLGGFLHWALWSPPEKVNRQPQRFVVPIPSAEPLVRGSAVALSPDGSRIAYVLRQEGRPQLAVRSMDRLEPTLIPDSFEARHPVFSPDGESLAFFADGSLKKIRLGESLATVLCEAGLPVGASWANDGIYFSTSAAGIYRVPSSGGEPVPITTIHQEAGEFDQGWPWVPRGSKALLFATRMKSGANRIEVLSLETGARRVLVEDAGYPRYASNYLFLLRGTSLFAARFDPERLELTSEPVQYLEGLGRTGNDAVDFALSEQRTIVYSAGSTIVPMSNLVLVDRGGDVESFLTDKRRFLNPRLSPDGMRLSVTIAGDAGVASIWLYYRPRKVLSRFTADGLSSRQIWSPDGHRLAFFSTQSGGIDIFSRRVDLSAPAERLTADGILRVPTSWSPEGELLLFSVVNPTTGWDVHALAIDDRSTTALLEKSYNERHAMFSPDSRWIAYTSDESRRDEVFVQSYPSLEAKWQISGAGGSQPVWSRDGKELFYRNGDRMMAVSVEPPSSTSPFGAPRELFQGRYQLGIGASGDLTSNYDVTPDGEFLMVREETGSPQELIVVLDWPAELERLTAPGN